MGGKGISTNVNWQNFKYVLREGIRTKLVTAPNYIVESELQEIWKVIELLMNSGSQNELEAEVNLLCKHYNITSPYTNNDLGDRTAYYVGAGESINSIFGTRTLALEAAFNQARLLSGNHFPFEGGALPGHNNGIWFDFGNHVAVVEHRDANDNNMSGIQQKQNIPQNNKKFKDQESQQCQGHFHIYYYDIDENGYRYEGSNDSRGIDNNTFPRQPMRQRPNSQSLNNAPKFNVNSNNYSEQYRIGDSDKGQHIFYLRNDLDEDDNLLQCGISKWHNNQGKMFNKIDKKRMEKLERSYVRPPHLEIPISNNINNLMDNDAWNRVEPVSSPITGKNQEPFSISDAGTKKIPKKQLINLGGVGTYIYPDKDNKIPSLRTANSIASGQGDHIFATLYDLTKKIKDTIGNKDGYANLLNKLMQYAIELDHLWHVPDPKVLVRSKGSKQRWNTNYEKENLRKKSKKNLGMTSKYVLSEKFKEKSEDNEYFPLENALILPFEENNKVWAGQEHIWGGLTERFNDYCLKIDTGSIEVIEYLANFIAMLKFSWVDYSALYEQNGDNKGNVLLNMAMPELDQFLMTAAFFCFSFEKYIEIGTQNCTNDMNRQDAQHTYARYIFPSEEYTSLASLYDGAFAAWCDAYDTNANAYDNLINQYYSCIRFIISNIRGHVRR